MAGRPGVFPSTRAGRASSPSISGVTSWGFKIGRYNGKPPIKPNKPATRRIRERALRAEMRSLRETNARAVIKRLNPIIRGMAACYRTRVSSEAFERWMSTCGSSHRTGPATATRTSRSAGSSPGATASQQVQAGPLGVWRPPERRLHAQVRLDKNPPAAGYKELILPSNPRNLGIASAAPRVSV
ncbi:MAG: hypothetical protein JO372_11725 [Solirubrobacterales bacterium]|nr:hypothetical protein [Solirubrobacterales bacterium]